MDKILDGKLCSLKLRDELKFEIEKNNYTPKVVDIQIGDDEASNIYIRNKKNAATKIGINFEHIKFSDNVDEKIIINKIIELNKDDSVNGILIQLPIPKQYNEKKLIEMIDPIKDVDGLTEANIGKLFLGKQGLVSCTPSGIIKLLKMNNVKISGKHVVIVGRSNLVGKPLIELFLRNDATVSVCHTKTKNLSEITSQADILVVACGCPNLINSEMIKNGCVIIDVGINRLNEKIVGDVSFDSVYEKVSKITKVPGGVGPMTITMLLYNTVKSYKMMNGFDINEK